MRIQTLLTILRKDLRDAIRDSRVVIAILVPLGVGVLYYAIFPDVAVLPSATVVYTAADTTTLPRVLTSVTANTVHLTLKTVATPADVRQDVANKTADLGLVIPAGFDSALQQGKTPALVIVRPASPSTGSSYTLAAMDQVLRQMAGQQPPAMMQVETAPSSQVGFEALLMDIGLRRYFVLASVVMLVGMITMLAVPIVLAEEREKKTLEALIMIASYPEVVAAKALLGVVYVAIAVPLLLMVTRVFPGQLLSFVAGFGLLSIGLIGFGLLLGSLFSANQLNTWGSIFLVPIILPAFFIGIPIPSAVEQLLLLIPSTHAMRLAVNSVTGTAIFPNAWLSYVVLVAWAAIAYALLLWRLSRRED